MVVDKSILIGLGVVIGIYLLYKLMFRRNNSVRTEYNDISNKILKGEEYKVKGQYEK